VSAAEGLHNRPGDVSWTGHHHRNRREDTTVNQAHPQPDPGAQVDGLLEQAETELTGLDRLTTHDQVAGYDHIHDALVQALARTTDATGPPGGRPVPGRSGA
jgi:hypothetical protein